MKKIRHTDSQILSILKQNEMGKSVPDLCREHGMSSACFYQWRSKYGGMDNVSAAHQGDALAPTLRRRAL